MRERLRQAELRLVRAATRLERHRPLRAWMLACTRMADGWALAVIIPMALVLDGARGFAVVACGTLSAVTVALVVHGVKLLVRRQRPQSHGVVLERPITAPDRHAFPSGHTAQAFGVLVLVAWLWPWVGLVGTPVAVSVGISRVFFGLHYPTDVAAGALLGGLLTLEIVLVATRLGLVDWLTRISPLG